MGVVRIVEIWRVIVFVAPNVWNVARIYNFRMAAKFNRLAQVAPVGGVSVMA